MRSRVSRQHGEDRKDKVKKFRSTLLVSQARMTVERNLSENLCLPIEFWSKGEISREVNDSITLLLNPL